MIPLVLIDRDGTINIEKHYLSDPDELELYPQTVEGIKLLRQLNLRVIIVTNQSAIGRGFFDETRLTEIHERLAKILKNENTEVDAIYFCPHIPEDNCKCRKPLTDMAEQAAADFNGDLKKSFVIGDKAVDIELGKNIGAVTILVRTGYGSQTEQENQTQPDFIVNNLLEAAHIISEKLKKQPF